MYYGIKMKVDNGSKWINSPTVIDIEPKNLSFILLTRSSSINIFDIYII